MEATKQQRPSPIPAGSAHATPYLIVRDAAKAIDFYKRAFHASEGIRFDQPDGRVGHAELSIGEAQFMLADEFPSMGIVGPQTLGGTSVSVHVYVADVDAFCERAIAQGAKLVRSIQDQFYGDRQGVLEDPYGHRWSFASRIEELTSDEMLKRAAQHTEPEGV